MLPQEILVAALVFASSALAHIAPTYPPPFRASYNPNSVSANIDYSITSPLDASGSNFPCKGYQVDMGAAGGQSVATWAQGGSYNMTTGSGALHGGGSCQLSLSYDKGASFNVIHSYIGSCPISAGQSFDFTMPSDAPTGAAMFAWTWFNMIGNREIYMDCASITVTAASSKTRSAPAVAFSNRPSIFVANLGNGCTTIEGTELVFPDPGPDVTDKRTTTSTNTISGTCAAVKGIGGTSGSSSSSNPTGSSSATVSGTATSASVASSSTSSASTSAYSDPDVCSSLTASAESSSIPGGVFVTVATPLPSASSSSNSTATTAAGSSTLSPAAAASTVATSTSPASTGTSGSGSAFKAGAACTADGEWNCVSGTSFQQCASGAWSVVQPLASGTKCTAGESTSINITKRSRIHRGFHASYRGTRGRSIRRRL